MRKILVPIAYWEGCRRALELGGRLARALGASLTVLHVAPPPRGELLNPGVASEKLEAWGVEPPPFQLLRQAEAQLKGLGLLRLDERGEPLAKHALKALAHGLYEVHLVGNRGQDVRFRLRQGDPVREILKEAEDPEYDLILTGTRGHQGLKRWLVGSVAHEVALHAPCSVLVAKNLKPDQDLLVGVTGRETAREAARQAGEIAQALGRAVVLLAVIPGEDEGRREEAERHLRSAQGVIPEGVPVERRVRVGDPVRALVEEAGETHIVVLGRLRPSTVKERLLGDVSLKVLDRSRGPVLIAAQPRPFPSSPPSSFASAASAASAGPAEARTASGEGGSEAEGTER